MCLCQIRMAELGRKKETNAGIKGKKSFFYFEQRVDFLRDEHRLRCESLYCMSSNVVMVLEVWIFLYLLVD
jgi:hypothetical protein